MIERPDGTNEKERFKWAQNRADNGGGIVANYGEPIALANVICWDNIARTNPNTAANGNYTLATTYSNIGLSTDTPNTTPDSSGNIRCDPLFVNPLGDDGLAGTDDDDLRLLAGSGCLNIGNDAAVPAGITTDLAGETRFWSRVDLGAYERGFQGFLIGGEPVGIHEGQAGQLTVRLTRASSADLVVQVERAGGDADIRIIGGSSLTFNASNWSTPQTVQLEAQEDSDPWNGQALLRVRAEGIPSRTIYAKEIDNDAVPQVVYVDWQAKGTGEGASWADAFVSLQDALQTAEQNLQIQEVRVAQGTYRPTIPDGNRMISFVLRPGLTLRGGYAGVSGENPDQCDPARYATILSGDLAGDDDNFSNTDDNSYHVLQLYGTGQVTTLDGMIVTGGYTGSPFSEADGAGIRIVGGQVRIKGCTFIRNASCYYGGAVYIGDGGGEIQDCRFENNRSLSGYGGAAFLSGNRICERLFVQRQSSRHRMGRRRLFLKRHRIV